MVRDEQSAMIGARDILVFRRIGPRWTHLGGLGRGAAWAGSIELTIRLDPPLRTVLSSGQPVRRHGQRPHQVVGPYWAATSIMLRVDDRHTVVLGADEPSPALLAWSDSEVADAATHAVRRVTALSPARHLADRLDELTALYELTSTAPPGLDGLIQHLCAAAVQTLQCDLGAIWLDDDRHAVVDHGWLPRGGPAHVVAAARAVAGRLGSWPDTPDWLVVPDATARPLPDPVGPDPQVGGYLALPLDVDGDRGCLLLVRRPGAPYGFSAATQSLAVQLAQTGSRLLEAAATHDELVRQLTSTREDALLDPLTGAANRRGWDEALVRAGDHVAAGGTVTVVTVDLDDLKWVNDTYGHGAGDELIVGCAAVLRAGVRGAADVVARVGGDEFTLLVRGADTDAVEAVRLLRQALECTSTTHGVPLRTSIGSATCPPRGSLADAVRQADAAMYRDKRARRRTS